MMDGLVIKERGRRKREITGIYGICITPFLLHTTL